MSDNQTCYTSYFKSKGKGKLKLYNCSTFRNILLTLFECPAKYSR